MNESRNWKVVSALMTLLVLCAPSMSATIYFDNDSSNGDWLTALNWSNDTLPTGSDFVAIVSGQSTGIAGGTSSAGWIEVRDGGTLSISDGDLTFGHGNGRWFWIGNQSLGTVNQSGGNIATSGNNVDLVVDSLGTYNMTGGSLLVADDLRLEHNSVFAISGNSTVTIGDDLRAPSGADVTIQVGLVGETAPMINVNDDLRLRGNVTLNIDATQWTGDQNVALFDIAGSIVGSFDTVTVNGYQVDPANYTMTSSSIIVPVTEPSGMALLAIGLITGLTFLWRAILGNDQRSKSRPTQLKQGWKRRAAVATPTFQNRLRRAAPRVRVRANR